jgi:hypothetical protein
MALKENATDASLMNPSTTKTHEVKMSEMQTELCGKCGAEIELSRRVDFTLKDGTRVCDSCFVKETPRPTQPARDWRN